MAPWQIAFACGTAFVVTHHAMSHPPIRQRLIDSLGYGPFLAAYSIVGTIFWGPLAVLWWQNTMTTPVWWSMPQMRVAATALSLCGTVLIVGGAVGGSRTSMVAQMRGQGFREVRGVNGFTRHPVFGGFLLLSVGHLLVDGGAIDVAFHGTNLVVALIGGWHQDQRALLTDSTYADWMKRTRLFPLPWWVDETVWSWRALAGVALGVVVATLARVFLHGA